MVNYKISNNEAMLTRQPHKHNPMLTRQLKLISAKGVEARAKILTPEQRKEIASKAAQARWSNKKDNNELRSQQSGQLQPSPGITYSESYGVSIPSWLQRNSL
jgi:hypothetical protein